MKKILSIILALVCILSVSLSCFAEETSVNATKKIRNGGGIQPMVNDNSPWTAIGGINGYKSIDVWIPPDNDTYACHVYSKSRVTGTTDIRDIDYIYVRVRCYNTNTSTLLGQSSASDTNAADVSTDLYGMQGPESYMIFYGTHQFREAGYYDIQIETTDNSF